MRRCPHDRIQYCPLYVAAHVVGLPTCIGRNLDEGCDISQRKLDYGTIVAKLIKTAVGAEIVEQCADGEWTAERQAQRARNMRAAGLH